ncbi:MAG: AzlC family ABC transporter permease [Lachnospiraceae bacterium]|nr:AzlC family ABC transporter permease [Lachnospiraceae bacterium]
MQHGIPISLGYLAVSFTLGIAAKNAGMTAFQATITSMLVNASAGQFAGFTLIAAQAGYLEMAVMILVANARYLLMSCALSQKLSPDTKFFHRLLIGFDVTDEIFGVSMSYPGKLNPFYTYGVIVVALPGWAIGTCFGVLCGNILPANVVSALSVGLYGMFLAIIIPPARKNKIIAGLVVLSMLASFLFSKLPVLSTLSSGIRIIILTVVISGIAAILFPVPEENKKTAT